MRERVFASLIISTLLYSISIIIGLILFFPLADVFFTALIISLSSGLLVFIFLSGIKIYIDRNEDLEMEEGQLDSSSKGFPTNNHFKDNDNNINEIEDLSNDEEEMIDDFSPLTPPVLEVDNEAHGRGE